jgi:hypothetical protein
MDVTLESVLWDVIILKEPILNLTLDSKTSITCGISFTDLKSPKINIMIQSAWPTFHYLAVAN